MSDQKIIPMQMERPEFALEDFESGRVFEWLSSLKSGYQQAMQEQFLSGLAKEVGFTGFAKCLKAYRQELNAARLSVIRDDGVSDFAGQPLELNVGEWTADESGIWRYGKNKEIDYACTQPIMPIQRLISIDTAQEKVKLYFRRSYSDRKPWQEIVLKRSEIADPKQIIKLADYGFSVTSGERARALVDFLRDVIEKNREVIPEVKAVSRMGWNSEGFSPYVGGVVFDSAENFRPVYKAIGTMGSMKKWLEEALDARTYSITARIILAASFASVLVEPLDCLPFFTHIWSMSSGTGKTVSLMLGASVWANPATGGSFLQTFKSTSVGLELIAGFLHSLPLFLDELQLSKDRYGKIVFNVYELSAGKGKLRSNKSLGLDYTPEWSNCFITSGESPIVSETDGAGAANRVIEIECKAGEKVIRNGHRTANVLKVNYGHAGKLFIQKLCEDSELDRAKELYEKNYTDCIQNDTTEKQAMAAAIILTADQLATEWIFQDGRALTAQELGEFLKKENEASLSERGYEYMCGWVGLNANQFKDTVERGEHYGIIENGYAIINSVVWKKVCADAGIDSRALLSHLKSKSLIMVGKKGFTRSKWYDGISNSCVWMKLPPEDDDENEISWEDELPL